MSNNLVYQIIVIIAGILLATLSNYIYDLLKDAGFFPDKPTLKRLLFILMLFLPLILLITIGTVKEEKNWAVTFEYEFSPGYWSNGDHVYTLKASCPNAENPELKGNVFPSSFRVSATKALFSDDVYMRWDGLSDEPIGGNYVGTITPMQPTIASYSYTNSTHTEADWLSKNCEVTVNPDDGSTYKLVAGSPFQP